MYGTQTTQRKKTNVSHVGWDTIHNSQAMKSTYCY